MQFANAFAHLENGLPQRNYYITPPSSPQPYRGAVPLGGSPLRQARAVQRNENLRSLRAIAPNAYEENGTIVIPPAIRRLAFAAPALQPRAVSLPPIRPVVREPEPEDPIVINSNSNNSDPNPRPPTRNRRRHSNRRRRRTARRRTRR